MNLEAIIEFKNEMRSYNYCVGMARKLQKEIDEIQHRMENVKSPALDSPYLPRGDSKSPKITIYPVDRKPSMIALKDNIKQKQAHWLWRINRVNECLGKLKLSERILLINIYINGESNKKVIDRMFKNSADKPEEYQFCRYLNELIEKAIEKEK